MAINSLSASSYGLSGIVSGMDTQSMVEGMLSGTQLKIDSTLQKKTVLEYEQSMYREVMAKLSTLQSSFLSFTSSTNLLSNSFYNTMNTSVSTAADMPQAFSVTASSSANTGSVTMDYIKQLATARTSKTQTDATGDVQGVLSRDAAQKIVDEHSGTASNMTIKVGDTNMVITDVAAKFGGKTQSEVVEQLNEVFAANGNVATASFVNNKLQINATNPDARITVSAASSSSFLSMAMFGDMQSMSYVGTLEAEIDTDEYLPGFDINLDGRTQTIHMDINALRTYAADGGSAQELLSQMQQEVQRKFGASVTLSGTDLAGDATFSFATGQSTQKMTITGDYKTMDMLGIESGMSNKLNTGMALKDLNFAQELQGNKHVFTINGEEFSYDSDVTLGEIIDDINSSEAGVKISYIESEDRFMIQSSQMGAGSNEFELSQSEGNLLSVMFGVQGGSAVQGYGINMPMTGSAVSEEEIRNGGTFTFDVDGTEYKFTVSRDATSEDPYTHETFAKEMNTAFANTFGILSNDKQALEFVYNDDNTFSIVANDKDRVVTAVAQDGETNTSQLGFTTRQSTLAQSSSAKLSDAGIVFGAGSQITIDLGVYGQATIDGASFTGDETMQQFADRLNSAISGQIASAVAADPSLTAPPETPFVNFDERTSGFRIVGVDVPMEIVVGKGDSSENLDNIFGSMSVAVNAPAASALQQTDEGSNAVFSINGSEIERASNSFTIDGLAYTLYSTTHTDPQDLTSSYNNSSRITVTRDTDQIVEGLQEFVDTYNETINFINEMYKADTTYKDYPPLTDEQKSGMSDNEIELWEEKAKEGLLRSDSTLGDVLQSLRSAMYTHPEGSSIAIYDLGISTSFYAEDGNFSIESVDDLRAMIESDPDAVRNLLAGTGGVMEQVNEAINNAVRSSYSNPGSLVSVAGANALDSDSSIYKQIAELDEQLLTLENRYWSEYDRYWSQFNAMEEYIAQMNSQSSWLTQQLGG